MINECRGILREVNVAYFFITKAVDQAFLIKVRIV